VLERATPRIDVRAASPPRTSGVTPRSRLRVTAMLDGATDGDEHRAAGDGRLLHELDTAVR